MDAAGADRGADRGAADAGFELVSRRLGALPLVNHFLARAGVPALLARYLPAEDAALPTRPGDRDRAGGAQPAGRPRAALRAG